MIDEFVAELNRRGLKPLFVRDVPRELRIAELEDMPEIFEWTIRQSAPNAWVTELESRLPCKFPDLYRALIETYSKGPCQSCSQHRKS